MRLTESELRRTRDRVPNLWSLVKDPEEFWGDLTNQGRVLLKELLEGTMQTWRDEFVGLDWHQAAPEVPGQQDAHGRPKRRRRTYRNGYYLRKSWNTAWGPLEQVRVPRCRDKGLTQRMFKRLQDHRETMTDSVIDMLLSGVSTRRVGELLEQIIGLSVSAGQVSRLAKRLDAEVRAFHLRPLEDKYVYLILDAIHLKCRGVPRLLRKTAKRTRRRIVLVAYGITTDGHKQILDFRLANGETRAAWESFTLNLYRRGLHGRPLKLITTDGHGGLIAAVRAAWSPVPRQRCWFHKMQNVAGKAKRRDQTAVLRGLRKVYAARVRKEAERAALRWADRWRTKYPKAVQCLEKDLEALLQVFGLPEEHRRMMRTTNGIERRFREVRRRTRPIGTFVNDASLERIVFGLISYENRKEAGRVCAGFRAKRQVA